MSFDLKSSNIKIFGTKPIEITNLANLDSLADLTGVTQKSVLFRNGTGLYDSDFNYDPSSNQLKIGSGYGFQESGSVIYFNSPGGFGGQASNSGRLNYNISSGSGNTTLGIYSATHSGIGYTKVGSTVYGDIISMDTITARFTDTSFVVKKPLIIEDSLQWPNGEWQKTPSSVGSSYWTNDANGITYSSGDVGIGTASTSSSKLIVNGGSKPWALKVTGSPTAIAAYGTTVGVNTSSDTGTGLIAKSNSGLGLQSVSVSGSKIASFGNDNSSTPTEVAYISDVGQFYADTNKIVYNAGNLNKSDVPFTASKIEVSNSVTDLNLLPVGITTTAIGSGGSNTPANYTTTLSVRDKNSYSFQLNSGYGNIQNLYYRNYNSNTGAWQPWQEIYHSGNLNRSDVDFTASSYSDANGTISSDYVASVTFSNAEVLANSTKTILSAPGSGKAIVIMRVMIH
ncbi:MAG TPA: hypothetical protein VJ991_04190, partial [Balneolales bacterium]|nr:hypothetical protein [Balneolales bacterium]